MEDFQGFETVNIASLCDRLLKVLDKSVERNLAEGILLSGGLDTSILAYLASKRLELKAFTAALQNAPAPDIDYARLMASLFRLKHSIHLFDESELCDAIHAVVKAMRSFDPMEIRNSVTIRIGLRTAKENGVNVVMTGDGCDELFAGYSYLFRLEEDQLGLELQKLWNVMSFSSAHLASALGVNVKYPYLDQACQEFAKGLALGLKVRSEKGQTWGKWILRKAFEKVLPGEIVWRPKAPIEVGSGTATLPRFFDSITSDTEFNEKKRKYLDGDKVVIRDKEQLFYYEVYRSTIGIPHQRDPKSKACPQCNSDILEKATYCRTCGAYPI